MAATYPGRSHSNADILSRLGLDSKAKEEPYSPATDADKALLSNTLSGDLLLPQLVHGNKEKLKKVQEDETSPSNESIIIEDSIFFNHSPSELNIDYEYDEPEVISLPQPTTIQ